jgi:hypothetical protein
MANMRKVVLVVFIHFAALGLWAQVEEANPGRPTVSTPATLTPVGYLQFETGVLGAEHSEGVANQLSFNEVLKFSPVKRLEFILQTQPFASTDIGRLTTHDAGDISAGFQAVLFQREGGATVSASYLRRVYGGSAPDLDIGSNRQSALLLASFEPFKFHVDTNAIFTEQIQDQAHRAQFGQTLSISHDLAHKFGMSGELWHFTQPFLRGNAAGLLLAPTYTPKPNLVFDGGFNRGLTSTSTRWEVFVGFTYLLPKKIL